MPRTRRFFIKTVAAGATLTLLLAFGMVLTIRRAEVVANRQFEQLRAAGSRIARVESMRRSAELSVSVGRGYLLTADPAMLPKLESAEASFDETLRALWQETLGAGDALLAAGVERSAQKYRYVQHALLAARRRDGLTELARRFGTELVPLRHRLEGALERLKAREERLLNAIYTQAEMDRERFSRRLYELLALLMLTALGLVWYFARRLAHAYRQEQDALASARRALAVRDHVMGVVAHDLRNPLAAIAIKATLLHRQAESPKTREQAESIQRVAEGMDFLIKGMLDAAILETGRLTVRLEECEAENIIRETFELFGELAAAKQIRLETTSSPALPPLRVDRARVLEALSNLIGNALKFTPAGGRITLSVAREGRSARFAVADTGPGIAGEHLPRVFDRFWKDEASDQPGAGLGLFIVKGIVETHGGRVWVESELGRGSTFYFTVPLSGAAYPDPR